MREVELAGDLASMLELGSIGNKPAPFGAGVLGAYRGSVKVVAGAGFGPAQCRLRVNGCCTRDVCFPSVGAGKRAGRKPPTAPTPLDGTRPRMAAAEATTPLSAPSRHERLSAVRAPYPEADRQESTHSGPPNAISQMIVASAADPGRSPNGGSRSGRSALNGAISFARRL
jgi:hypothetical protein